MDALPDHSTHMVWTQVAEKDPSWLACSADNADWPAMDPQPRDRPSWESEARARGPGGQLLSLSGCMTTSKSGDISSHRSCICYRKARRAPRSPLGHLKYSCHNWTEASPPPPALSQGPTLSNPRASWEAHDSHCKALHNKTDIPSASPRLERVGWLPGAFHQEWKWVAEGWARPLLAVAAGHAPSHSSQPRAPEVTWGPPDTKMPILSPTWAARSTGPTWTSGPESC